ncbi:MAG: pyridoxal-phosphate dependent enzyme, partial [Gemmatimonadaceae bacterium]|nr:pyridoxal-phosphate dependent enzyme [Gemmatimonadaceae bacterium]
EHARKLERRLRLAFVHPFDDPDVIAGQGTIGMEILRQSARPIHAVFVAIGGGGLVSGVASYVKRLQPGIKVIGVQPVDSDAMKRSIADGRRVAVKEIALPDVRAWKALDLFEREARVLSQLRHPRIGRPRCLTSRPLRLGVQHDPHRHAHVHRRELVPSRLRRHQARTDGHEGQDAKHRHRNAHPCQRRQRSPTPTPTPTPTLPDRRVGPSTTR